MQINPEHDPRFGACLMVVTEPKVFGAQGYVKLPGGGLIFYRCAFEHMELIGKAVWILCNDADQENS